MRTDAPARPVGGYSPAGPPARIFAAVRIHVNGMVLILQPDCLPRMDLMKWSSR